MKLRTLLLVLAFLAVSTTLLAQEHFPEVAITDANHSLLVTECRIGNRVLEGNDEVAAFDPDGVCAGVALFEAEPGTAGLALWRDDPQSEDDEGFEEGDAIICLLWDARAHREVEPEMVFVDGSETWTRDGFSIANLSAEAQPHFEVAGITDRSHSIVAENCNVAERMLAIGDEVGAFDSEGVCAGLGVFEEDGNDGMTGIALFGDDPETELDEGFEAGEQFNFRFWDSEIERETPVEMEILDGANAWEINGFSVVGLYSPGVGVVVEGDLENDFGIFDRFMELPETWTSVIANRGNGDLFLENITCRGDTTAFDVELSGDVIPANDTSFVEISFTFPSENCEPGRNYEAFFTLHTSDEPVVYHLVGETGAARFVIDRDSIDMGFACPGDDGYNTPQQTFDTIYVVNPGSAAALLRGITFGDSAFHLAPDFNDSTLLLPGEELVIPIVFDPWVAEEEDHRYGGLMQFDVVSSELPSLLHVWLFGEAIWGNDVTPEAPASAFSFHLAGAYPNPFNSSTTITFGLDKSAPTRLAVYDLQGMLVRELADERMASGTHKVVWDAGDLGAGVYMVRLEGNTEAQIQKLVLLR